MGEVNAVSTGPSSLSGHALVAIDKIDTSNTAGFVKTGEFFWKLWLGFLNRRKRRGVAPNMLRSFSISLIPNSLYYP